MHEFRPATEVERDGELASALLVGDADAVRTLFDRFGSTVFGVALALVGEEHLAAGVTQHVFLQAWRNAGDFEPGRAFSPWLATLTRQAAAAAVSLADQSGSSPGRCANSAEAVDAAWAVRSAIGHLDADERAVARAHHLESTTGAQVAADLGISADDAVRLLGRAERVVSNRLDHVVGGDAGPLLGIPELWVNPPAGLGDRVVSAVRSESTFDGPDPVGARPGVLSGRRIPGWFRSAVLGALAVVGFLLAGIVVLSALSDVEPVESFDIELTSTGALPDVGGDISVTEFDSGLRIELDVAGLPVRDSEAVYLATVQRDDGASIVAGSFRDGGSNIDLWVGVELDRAELFVVTIVDIDSGGAIVPAMGDVVLRASLQR